MIIKLNNIDITDQVSVKRFQKIDYFKSRSDDVSLLLEKAGSSGVMPKGTDKIEIIHKGNTIYLGTILRVDKRLKAKNMVECTIEGIGPERELNRKDVVERYYNTTVNDIIKNELVPNYTSGYTTNNVSCNINVGSIAFNHISLTDCLDKLAKLTNFYWYVDYDKDIHFFAKNDELAPENISDAQQNHITGTLELREDFSQIKNVVKLRGGVADALEDTKNHIGDGNQTNFDTELKFTNVPTITVDGVTQNVGLAYLNDINDYDALWSYQEKFVKFATAPANSAQIIFTGIPESPILVQTNDSESIGEFGEWEYFFKDENIESRDEAYKRAQAEIEASKDEIISGNFSTYTDGFHSGQTIAIQNSNLDIDETFIIEQVTTKLVTPNDGSGNAKLKYAIKVSSNHRVDIIEFLQDRLFDEELLEDNTDTLLSFRTISDTMGATDSIGTITTTSPPYQYDSGTQWGFGTYVA